MTTSARILGYFSLPVVAGSATLALASVGLLAVPAHAVDPSPASFSASDSYSVGTAPRQVVTGDVNGDGKLDALTADSSSGRVSLLLGNGDGTFASSYAAVSTTQARSVALGDMNKDGKLDIVSTFGASNSVNVSINNGEATPTFTSTAYAINSASGMRGVVVADFNKDTWPDIAAVGATSAKLGVLLSNGSGGFNTYTEVATIGSNPTGLETGDLNGDGAMDVVSFNRNGVTDTSTVTVFLNGGSGTFAAAAYGLGNGPDFGALGDVDGDGDADVIAVNTISPDSITIGLNDGSGVLTKGSTYATTGTTIAEGAAAADFNLDGFLDVAVATNANPAAANVFYGKGDGTFLEASTVATWTSMPYGAAAADLNSDGRPDLLLTSTNGTPNNVVGVLLNTTPTTPATPGAPAITSATPGNVSASVVFTAPASDGGSTITNYEYSTDGGTNWSTPDPAVTTSPLVISGLTNNASYQVAIRAVNANGSGTASTAVSVRPTAKPPAPQSVSYSGGVLSWSAPDWASAPTAYVVSYKKWADRNNPAVPWAVYAARSRAAAGAFGPNFTVPTQLRVNATKNACGAGNAATGWAHCPMPYGFAPVAEGYAMRVNAMNGSTFGSVSAPVQVTP